MPTAELAVADVVIGVVVLVSAVFGLLRGFVKEVVAVLIWVGAVLASMAFGPKLGALLGLTLSARLQNAIGFGAVFITVLIAGALLQRLLGRLVESTGLSGTNRTIGLVFGIVRGVVVVTGVLILLRPFAGARGWWSESLLVPPLLALEPDLMEFVNAVLEAFGAAPVSPLDQAAKGVGAALEARG